MLLILRSTCGLFALLLLAWLFSEQRKAVPWKTVVSAVALQLLLAVVLLKLPGTRQLFLVLNKVVFALEAATQAGTSFVFGYLGGAAPPFEAVNQAAPIFWHFAACRLSW